MKTLIMMVGVPGSGKTTFIKKHINEKIDKHISRDLIRFSMLKDGDDYFSKEKEVFNEFIRQIDEALLITPRYVYVDATHLNKSSRARVLKRLKNVETYYAAFMDISLEDAKDRNRQRTGKAFVPEKSIEEMFKRLSYPTKDEGFSAIISIDKDMNIKIKEGEL